MASDRKPFKVVNCIPHGFAVAGPSEAPGVDLELIQWGMLPGDARAKADDLNAAPNHVPRKD